MREFYEDILKRNPPKPTALERAVLWECAQAEDLTKLHELRMEQMMEDIRHRKAEAEAFGEGSADWAVATFEGLLIRALKYGDPMTREEMMGLSPAELSLRRTAQRNRPAAEAYELRKQGLACENREVERKLLRLYESVVGRMEGKVRAEGIQVQTLRTLQDSQWVFRKEDANGIHYRFYRQSHLLGTCAVQLLTDRSMVIQCGGLLFNSRFDPQDTVVPNVFRDIVDADDPTLRVGRLTWLAPGRHELTLFWETGPMTVQICREEGELNFYLENRCIAGTVSLPEKQEMLGWELSMCMKFHEHFSAETELLLMCVPLLCFGI